MEQEPYRQGEQRGKGQSVHGQGECRYPISERRAGQSHVEMCRQVPDLMEDAAVQRAQRILELPDGRDQ
jgi:hypothetical protein